jgi:hypothetical protein
MSKWTARAVLVVVLSAGPVALALPTEGGAGRFETVSLSTDALRQPAAMDRSKTAEAVDRQFDQLRAEVKELQAKLALERAERPRYLDQHDALQP